MKDPSKSLLFIVNHVFMPPKLPQEDDLDEHNERDLCGNVCGAAREFGDAIPPDEAHHWNPLSKFLKQFSSAHRALTLSENIIIRSLKNTSANDILAFFIRTQNAGVVIRKGVEWVIFELFEVSPTNEAVMGTKEKLLRTFPDPAVQIPTRVFDDPSFQAELAKFLAEMDAEQLDSGPTTVKAKSEVPEVRDTAHPRYITQLLTEILRGMGEIADVPHITKRIADDVIWCDAYKPWRRSATWLVIKVALHTSLIRQSGGHRRYKEFMAFVHARILKLGVQSELPSYLIACMQRKTARRLMKLGTMVPPFLEQYVNEAVAHAAESLQQRWTQAQTLRATSLSSGWAPKTLNIAADTVLSLHNCKPYLKRSLQEAHTKQSIKSFTPNHPRRLVGKDNFARSSDKKLSAAFGSDDNLIALMDFECAVLKDLKDWSSERLASSDAHTSLATCMEAYFEAASKVYSSDPELISIMILTLFKLWVELDRMTISQCPLLAEFSPEIPTILLHPLLLRAAESIEALDYVEKYLTTRHSQATAGQSVFSNLIGKKSFAAQYFDASPPLQALKLKVEDAARIEREKKIEKLHTLKARCEEWKRSAESLQCRYINKFTPETGLKPVHAPKCLKCRLENQAREMRIEVHEWPLPQDPWQAKVVLFEVSPPPAFVIWRKLTYKLLREVCIPKTSPSTSQRHQMQLHKYPAFTTYQSRASQDSPVLLASSTKSFKKSHYRSQKVVEATDSSICVNHGLSWALFDSSRSEWITQKVAEVTINDLCVFQLSPGRYQSLQYAVSDTSHTSNDIVADQTLCPPDLTLHEFYAFARIRSGPRLQWLNIASELRCGTLSFQEEAVYSLLRQAAWQVGPLTSDGQREWHIELSERDFGLVLISELEDLVPRLKANRRNVIGMRVITTLLSRLLSSATDEEVIKKGLKLMREVRIAVYMWLPQNISELREIEDEARWQQYQLQIFELATTCRGTYDVDPEKASLLLRNIKDVAIFVHCAILVNQHSPSNIMEADLYHRNLFHRDRRISHVMESLLSQQISNLSKGLDKALPRVWKFYRPSHKWEQLASPNNRWVRTSTAQEGIQESQVIQLDLLSGQLLIDGKPFGRLPNNISTHPMYFRIFGQRIMDVIPADIPGMDFKTSNPVGSSSDDGMTGYEVFFGLRQTKSKSQPDQLAIRVQQGSEILELIPHDVFNNDLPAILVKNQTHWLNLSTRKGEIEIRDLATRWMPSPNNWRIHFSPHGQSWMSPGLQDGGDSKKLVDPRSATMSMISAQLHPLENLESLIATYSSSSGQLTVSLPRFGLDFFLNDEPEPHLESSNMPGMVVDNNQSSDTMIGLNSQLILRDKHSPDPSLRQVIIPYISDPRFNIFPTQHHNDVTLSIGDHEVVRYLRYTINSVLGRLDGDETMLSKLYRAYLHAITSHCLPDPLTGRTGTEEALRELRSAGIISFQKLGEEEHQLLQLISQLTPTRTFYPSNLRVMQNVNWSMQAICPLAQHSEFLPLASSIWKYAETLEMFAPTEGKTWGPDSHDTSDHLLHRAARRNAIFDRDQSNGSSPSASDRHDVKYHSRGRTIYTTVADEGAVFDVSTMVFNWSSRPLRQKDSFTALKQLGSVSGIDERLSSFSRKWLHDDVGKLFLSACNMCQTAIKAKDLYRIAFLLSACTYASADIRPFIPTIFAFAVVPELRAMHFPSWPSYDLSKGQDPSKEEVSNIILQHALPFEQTGQLNFSQMQQKTAQFNTQRSLELAELIGIFERQWPCKSPVVSKKAKKSRKWLFDILQVQKEVSIVFETWFRNRDLCIYIQKVQNVLDSKLKSASTQATSLYGFSPDSCHPHPIFSYPSFQQLFAKRRAPKIPLPPTPLGGPFRLVEEMNSYRTDKLKTLLKEFRESTFIIQETEKPGLIQQRYADDLEISLGSLEAEAQSTGHCRGLSKPQMLNVVLCYYEQCERHLLVTHKLIRESLLPSTQAEKALLRAGLWPCLATMPLLGVLSFGSNVVLPEPWRTALNSFAHAILMLQHARRLTSYLHSDSLKEFISESGSIKIERGDVGDEQYSTRLLIQVDGDFLARPIQLDFMKEMIAPSSKRNAVLQLNMGEGKSSVIVPLVAAALSEGKKLVRVVVLRPLAPSMFHLLVNRLGGLANRRVFYLPFSRTPKLSASQAQQVQGLLSLCVRVRGVLVIQPDHILSFKLMGLDRSFNHTNPAKGKKQNVAQHLVEAQRWLDRNSRDILDESDEILHVKYQLVYTVGHQQSLHGSPDRWVVAQQVLALVRKHADAVSYSHPEGFERVDDHTGRYPRIRILKEEAGIELVRLIGNDILEGALEQCPFDLLPSHLRPPALSYITTLEPTSSEIHQLENYLKQTEFWNNVLIVRGLLAYGILQFVLKEKRWRVDYGPDPTRSMLAVPYRAKDVPSRRAEFSHPDVAILTTCLNYYWQGLSEQQLEQCFNLLVKQDNPSLHYRKWVHQGSVSIPKQFMYLAAISMQDRDQRLEMHRLFRYNQAVIDFFLSCFVFPREAKEFPKKMSTSAWDLAERKGHVTTGFSGTNDGRYLLPTSIDQEDPLAQSSTNAKVLTYLLQPENDFYQRIHQYSQQGSEESFLRHLNKQKPEIRVLLDVGAQILTLSNDKVAEVWLNSNNNRQIMAIVFFGSDDEPYVRTRNGLVEALVSSAFRQQLDKCLLYLDDAHTRGTDFRIPSGTRAAVTLGPKVTKDRLLQGCMRMRMLGHGHSVTFFAPAEVDRGIRAVAKLGNNEAIHTRHVLLWAMFESCLEVVQRIPQWAQQGVDHRTRDKAWLEFSKSPASSLTQLESAWVQDEARSLDQMYALNPVDPLAVHSDRLRGYPDISARYLTWAPSSFLDTRFQEEQEREVIQEVEAVRHVQRPPKSQALIPSIHPDVRILVQKGVFKKDSPAFVKLFRQLPRVVFEDNNWSSPYLYCTKVFSITTEASKQGNSGDYLNPVNWILSSIQAGTGRIFVVISPFEVNALLPEIRRSKAVHLHQYSPRITQEMKSFDDLAFHCIPPLSTSWVKPNLDITTRLNLWAGQLYLEDETAYHHLCNFLGLYSWQPRKGDTIQPDGFIKPKHRHGTAVVNSSFQNSPVPYLKRLFTARRKGMDYAPTHMGRILRGRLLAVGDFHKSAAEPE
ncbi:hypothetical protein FRC02_007250 [Tulasnella sp. 418]|nr:hypothetical protein FRC02_007250 [Tulasnella sp. 418]